MWAVVTPMQSGPRGVWLAAWTCADRDTPDPEPVYPSNRVLAERAGGITPRSAQRHLEWLALAGWVRVVERNGQRYIHLAWIKPRQDWADAAKAAAESARIVMVSGESDTATILADTSSGLADDSPGLSPPHDNIVIHTLDNLGSTLENHLSPDPLAAPVLAVPLPRPTGTRRRETGPAQPSLPIPGADPPPNEPPTDRALVVEFWAWFNVQRSAAYARWRPDQPIREYMLTKGREAELRSRLNDNAKGKPLTDQLAIARHVIAVASSELDRDRGQVLSFDGKPWDSMRRLEDHWLRAKHFDRMAAAPAPPPESPKPSDGYERVPYTRFSMYSGEMDRH